MGRTGSKVLWRYLAAVTLLVPAFAAVAHSATDVGPTRLAAQTTTAFAASDTIAIRFAGRIPGKQPGPDRAVFEGDMTSLATGEPLGTFTWDLTCHGAVGIPCGVYEVTNTFRFAEGTLVTKEAASVAPDGTAPGFFHVGIHPQGKSVIEATGVFAGRTGTAHMSGRHGGQEFPAWVDFDDFWLIELDPR